MHSHLNGVKNVPRILAIMKSGKAKIAEWKGLLKVALIVLCVVHSVDRASIVHLSRGHVTGFFD
jgi:DNA mismatch repair protein MSH5